MKPRAKVLPGRQEAIRPKGYKLYAINAIYVILFSRFGYYNINFSLS